MSEQGDAVDMRECEEQLRFETLLTDLSARFINLPADQVDAAIENAQRQVCECIGLDISALWEWASASCEALLLTHLCRPLGGPPVPARMAASESFPWCLSQLAAGRQVMHHCVEEDSPAAAAVDLASWRHYGIRSNLGFPLSTGAGGMIGVLSFCTTRRRIRWSDSLVKRLRLVAEVFANAIARKRSDQALRESEARLALAADSAGAGLWSLDLATGSYWLTDKAKEHFGFGLDEPVTLDRVFEAVLPEDRALVRQVIDEVVATGDEGRVEYRIVLPNGSARWMASRGRVHGLPGKPPTHLMGVTVDITDTKNAVESLKQSEFRLATAVDVAGLGFYEVANGEDVTFLDSRAGDLVGLSGRPTLGISALQFWIDHLAPEDRPRILDLHQRLNGGDLDRITVEFLYSHPQRGLIWLQLLSHVVDRDAAGHAHRTIGVFRDISARKTAEQDLQRALDEVKKLRDQLHNENLYLREQMRSESGHGAIVGESEPIRKMLALAKKVGPTQSAVLITGETGTGKELLAQAIHELSSRSKKIMVKVNCAALPAPLIESELFGREKGAYTGAMTQQVGRFEVANGSTIFLDEIGDLPLDLQVKLLRVLQDGLYERLGSNRTIKTDVRLIAATNRDLIAMVRDGQFREDLFHRLNVFPIEAPPLRIRVADIPLLAWKFIQEFNVKMGRSIDSVPKSVMERLKQYPWPGNVRELRNVIERAMILSEGRSLMIELPETDSAAASLPSTLQDLDRKHILEVLERTHWRIRGKQGAAEILGLAPTTLHSRMKKLGISRPER